MKKEELERDVQTLSSVSATYNCGLLCEVGRIVRFCFVKLPFQSGFQRLLDNLTSE